MDLSGANSGVDAALSTKRSTASATPSLSLLATTTSAACFTLIGRCQPPRQCRRIAAFRCHFPRHQRHDGLHRHTELFHQFLERLPLWMPRRQNFQHVVNAGSTSHLHPCQSAWQAASAGPGIAASSPSDDDQQFIDWRHHPEYFAALQLLPALVRDTGRSVLRCVVHLAHQDAPPVYTATSIATIFGKGNHLSGNARIKCIAGCEDCHRRYN